MELEVRPEEIGHIQLLEESGLDLDLIELLLPDSQFLQRRWMQLINQYLKYGSIDFSHNIEASGF